MLQTKVKGLDEWRPKRETNYKVKEKIAPVKHEGALKELLDILGTNQMTIYQLVKASGRSEERVRFRMDILVKRKQVKRTTGMMPFLYFKA